MGPPVFGSKCKRKGHCFLRIREYLLRTVERFFGIEFAKELVENGDHADLMTANNVLAHVPDINDFVTGFEILLSDAGVATFEFPHLLNLVSGNQFDTIYHEHF
jgi:2-polyprenyl-3-methyl-5-hydroxy-6-metoxy-1,4-benzoquinol methylase